MVFLLDTLFAFLLLIATFGYLRAFAAVIRSMYPDSLTEGINLTRTTILYIAPSVMLGLLLYFLYYRLGIVWISPTAIWISWALDLLYTLGMLYYYLTLKQIRDDPASFGLRIRLQEYARLPSVDSVRRPLDYLLSRLPTARRWKSTTVLVRQIDFRRFLRNDLRLVDEVDDPISLIREFGNVASIPHLLLSSDSSNGNRWQHPGDRDEDSSNAKHPSAAQYSRSEASRSHVINRGLNARLNAADWETSTRLCERPPLVIARMWRAFHYQESLRLRFVALLNTADMLQRLMGAVVFSALRDRGKISDGTYHGSTFQIPGNSRTWNKTLGTVLRDSDIPELGQLRDALLQPRVEFEIWQNDLLPFEVILGQPIVFTSDSNSIDAWDMLVTLRNKIIGHGGIGKHIQLRPLTYLAAIHRFFLSSMREAADQDLAVRLASSADGGEIVVNDRGFSALEMLPANYFPFGSLMDKSSLVNISPYVRYHEGRMLIINKFDSKKGIISYTDYNSTTTFEPYNVTMSGKSEDFILPASN